MLGQSNGGGKPNLEWVRWRWMPGFLLTPFPLQVCTFPQQSNSVNTSLGFPLPTKANIVNSRKGKKSMARIWKPMLSGGRSRALHLAKHYLNFVEPTLEFKLYPWIQYLAYENNHWRFLTLSVPVNCFQIKWQTLLEDCEYICITPLSFKEAEFPKRYMIHLGLYSYFKSELCRTEGSFQLY